MYNLEAQLGYILQTVNTERTAQIINYEEVKKSKNANDTKKN